jgi:hypothetical protein
MQNSRYHRRRVLQVASLLVASLLGASSSSPRGQAAPAASTASNVRTTAHHTVTLLGVTRGVTYLASAESIADGNRRSGSNPVAWLQIKLLVERDGNRNPLGWYRWHVRTLDGEEFVSPRGSSRAETRTTTMLECELKDPRLPGLLYPAALPTQPDDKQARVLILGLSGKLLRADKAELVLSLGDSEDEAERLVFQFPMP